RCWKSSLCNSSLITSQCCVEGMLIVRAIFLNQCWWNRGKLTLDRHRYCIASAQAERSDALMNIAASHLVYQRNQHARATCADRMSQCHGAAVDIHFVDVQPQFTNHTQRLNGEGLVQFV